MLPYVTEFAKVPVHGLSSVFAMRSNVDFTVSFVPGTLKRRMCVGGRYLERPESFPPPGAAA
jgi:hypothetical protein